VASLTPRLSCKVKNRYDQEAPGRAFGAPLHTTGSRESRSAVRRRPITLLSTWVVVQRAASLNRDCRWHGISFTQERAKSRFLLLFGSSFFSGDTLGLPEFFRPHLTDVPRRKANMFRRYSSHPSNACMAHHSSTQNTTTGAAVAPEHRGRVALPPLAPPPVWAPHDLPAAIHDTARFEAQQPKPYTRFHRH